MRLLILCEEPGLRAALAAQFRDHRQAVVRLEAGQAFPAELTLTDEPVFVIDCLGRAGNPCVSWLAEDVFAQLSAHCERRDWVWLLLSDSRVFPVPSKRRFGEADTPAPCTHIGEQLLAREHYVTGTIARHLVLRAGPLIAAHGDNMLTRLLHELRAGGPMVVPELQRFCPTPATDVARVIAAIHDQVDCGAAGWGIYHYESADPVAGEEFAEVVLAAAAQYWPLAEGPVQLQGVTVDGATDIFPLLDCHRIRDTFGIQQLPWRKAVPAMLKQIYTGD